jgi:hypothetical protein
MENSFQEMNHRRRTQRRERERKEGKGDKVKKE